MVCGGTAGDSAKCLHAFLSGLCPLAAKVEAPNASLCPPQCSITVPLLRMFPVGTFLCHQLHERSAASLQEAAAHQHSEDWLGWWSSLQRALCRESRDHLRAVCRGGDGGQSGDQLVLLAHSRILAAVLEQDQVGFLWRGTQSLYLCPTHRHHCSRCCVALKCYRCSMLKQRRCCERYGSCPVLSCVMPASPVLQVRSVAGYLAVRLQTTASTLLLSLCWQPT